MPYRNKEDKINEAIDKVVFEGLTVGKAAKAVGIYDSSIYRYLKKHGMNSTMLLAMSRAIHARQEGRCDLCGILESEDDSPHINGRCEVCRSVYGDAPVAEVMRRILFLIDNA